MRKVEVVTLLLIVTAGGSVRASEGKPAPTAETASIVLTAIENATEPQSEFRCNGRIHGYIRLPSRQVGVHELECHWIAPDGKPAAQSRNEVEFPPPGRSTAYVWFAFPDPPALGLPDPELDKQFITYPGTWHLEVFWDDRPLIKTSFVVRCP